MPIERAKRQGLVIVNTGNGKGKTTAALGVVLRAWGRDWNVCVLQFIKAKTSNYGEHRAAAKLGIEIVPLGDGFTWLSKDIEQDKALARECWEQCRQRIASDEYDLIVMDELTYALVYDWLPVEEVIATLEARPRGLHVIITGRDAPAALIEYADLVTEMNEIKHPYRTKGLRAQPGIEF